MLKSAVAALLAALFSMLGVTQSNAWTHGTGAPVVPSVQTLATNGDNAPQGFSPTNYEGFYDATANKTWIAWGGVTSGTSYIFVRVYDNASATWGAPVQVMANNVTDGHGYPSIIQDANGFVYIFCCSHQNAGGQHNDVQYAYTTSARSETAWSSPTQINAGTFSAPTIISGTLWLNLSFDLGSPRQEPSIMSATVSGSGGLGAFSALQTIVDGGDLYNNGETFASNQVLIGTKICFAWTYSPLPAAYHYAVQFGCYETADGSFKNVDGSFSTAAGSLPISYATANAHYDIYNNTVPTTSISQIYTLVDNGGTIHVFYADGPEDGTGNYYSPAATLYEQHWTGSVWSTRVDTGGRVYAWGSALAAIASSDGGYDLYWPQTGFDVRTTHFNGSTFNAPTIVYTVTDPSQSNYCLCWVGTIFNTTPTSKLFLLMPMTSFYFDSNVHGDLALYVFGKP